MVIPTQNYMGLALEQARLAAATGEVPVGAVLIDPKRRVVVAQSGNLVRTNHDPTAHAEICVIRDGARKCGSERLTGLDLYVTLEPCPMCAQAISFARLRRLYYGAADPKGGGVHHGPRIFSQPTCHHVPEIYEGLAESEAAAMLKCFFQDRRKA